jgi:hypothetical protein
LQKWGPCWSKVWHVKNIILINRIYFVYPIFSFYCALYTKSRICILSKSLTKPWLWFIGRIYRVSPKISPDNIITFILYFLKCTANHSHRNNLFNKIILNKPDFIEEIPLDKMKMLLDSNSELLAEVAISNLWSLTLNFVNNYLILKLEKNNK